MPHSWIHRAGKSVLFFLMLNFGRGALCFWRGGGLYYFFLPQIMGLLEWITVITRRLDFGQSTESNESVGDGVPGSPGRDASEG